MVKAVLAHQSIQQGCVKAVRLLNKVSQQEHSFD